MIQKSKRIEERIEEKGNEGKEQAKAKKSKVAATAKTMEAKTEKWLTGNKNFKTIDRHKMLISFSFSLFTFQS
tara:strand:+ start:66 stop:284 length:219 start_codon:yes stop_codon:yes gene_type:complete